MLHLYDANELDKAIGETAFLVSNDLSERQRYDVQTALCFSRYPVRMLSASAVKHIQYPSDTAH